MLKWFEDFEEFLKGLLGMDQDRNNEKDHALTLIANSLSSIAQSFAVIAANTSGITPAQTAAIQKVTSDLQVSHDKLQAAVDAAQPGT